MITRQSFPNIQPVFSSIDFMSENLTWFSGDFFMKYRYFFQS